MDSKDLLQWAVDAFVTNEKSWIAPKNGEDVFSGKYEISRTEAAEKTRPKEATSVDFFIVDGFFLHRINDLTYYYKVVFNKTDAEIDVEFPLNK